MFSCEYCKIFKNSLFYRTSQVADFLEDQSRLNELYYGNLYTYENISQTSENIWILCKLHVDWHAYFMQTILFSK